MAVLHLMLQQNPDVRSVKELQPVCEKHKWVEGKKFLLVPYHMINAKNMETAIFKGYVDYVSELHPTAPFPGVFLADEIFENARQHRSSLGDDKFFAELNKGKNRWQQAGGWRN